MEGLRIRTASGYEFEINGPVSYKAEFNCYYCTGESRPAEIVKEVKRA